MVENVCLLDSGTEDDLCYMEVQRLRARGQTWKDTTFTGSPADRVKHVWDILQSGFSRGYWDFMYLLEESDRRGLTFKADYVAVDEINDLTPLQCRIVGRSEGTKVVFCGDLNQCIYEFTGVDVQSILDIPHDKVEYQNRSYRLTNEVAEYAGQVISRLSEPYGERIIPLAGTGEVIRDNSFLNILGKLPTFGDTLVLGRTNHVVDQARRIALDAGANVVMSEDERLIKDLYDLIKNRPLTFPLEKLDCILGSWVPSKRFWRHGAKKTLRERVGSSSNRWMSWDELYSYGSPDLPRLLKGEVFLDGLREGFDPSKPAVNFMTAHASKGCEEKNVVVLRDLGQRVSEGLNLSGENEIRLSYVAVTRGKKRVFISSLGSGRLNPYLA